MPRPPDPAQAPDLPPPRHAAVPTRIGDLTVVARGDVVTGVFFPGHWTHPGQPALGTPTSIHDQIVAAMGAELAAYLEGDLRWFSTPFRAIGTPLEEAIWAALLRIDYGATTTYGALARSAGMPGGAQAIGRIVGANPVSIVVPCHRVVGHDGGLTGYAGGLERKSYLLDLEAYLTGQTLIDPR